MKSARENLYEMATVAFGDNVPPPVRASVTLMLDLLESEAAERLADRQRSQREKWERDVFSGGPAALGAVEGLIDLIDPRVT